ncbi:WD40 repeat domain-containing protein [Frigoriglobus tundricola]|uniref:Uncharacterized protein n=1 Tax=Frigoriglobus tundricola TaxID=2774151 RepID=A0A6M5YU67_9BACT|nr:hypothetical protein [Frigoriglobus tundricola]QJW96462.1 hypothetical protein FTUN_4019 [Frigoriglobus tundricola]
MIPLQTGFRHPVTHLLFSPDGSTIAVAQPHSGITLIERASGRTIAVCARPRHAGLTGLTFCGDGRFLAAASAKGIVVFDASTGARVLANAFHLHPRLLADRGGVVLGATLTKDAAVRPELGPSGSGLSERLTRPVFDRKDFEIAALAPDGALVVGSEQGEWWLRGVGNSHLAARVERPATAEPARKSVAKFCPLGRRFAINDGHTLDVYDGAELTEGSEDDQPTGPPLVQRANGSQVMVAPMPHVVLAPTFTLAPEKRVAESRWHPPFALAADGRGLLVKRPRNRIQWWDAPSGTLVNEWSWRFEWVTCVAVSADGLTAVAGGRFGRVVVWDLE